MDTSINSIILVSVLLLVISLAYVVYIVYNDSEKIKGTINLLTGQVNERINTITENINGMNSKFTEMTDLLESVNEENADEESDDETEGSIYNTEHAIYDQLLSSNSDQLKRLQLVQSEFENGKILDDSENDSRSSDESDNENDEDEVYCKSHEENDKVYCKSDEENDDKVDCKLDGEKVTPEIDFISDNIPITLCNKVLKTGKNKGNICGKECITGNTLCKTHTS